MENQIQITQDTLSLILVAIIAVAFVYYLFTDNYKPKGVEVVEKKEPNEEADEVVETIVIEGVVVEQKIEGKIEQLSTVFREIDMALMPEDTEVKQVRWLRDQKAALQPKGKKRPVLYEVAQKHLTDYQVYVGRRMILTQQRLLKKIAESEEAIGPASP